MSTRTKPATPPKPNPSKLTCPNDPQRSKDEGGSIDKFENESTSRLKRGNTLPQKPALYPKPVSPVKKPLEKVRPQIPRRPDHVPTDGRSSLSEKIVTKRKSNLSLSVLKAPVAKLEEFDTLYQKCRDVPVSPVRPPRSPKIKAFLDGPFSKDDRPELPVKKRMLCNLDKGDKDWDNIKKRSASLGRSEISSLSQGTTSGISLCRKLSLEDLTRNEDISSQSKKAGPIPPPRRRKKSEESPSTSVVTSTDFPIYAQVNYEMKKNRRSACETNNETVAVVEGKLLLAGSSLQNNSIHRLINNIQSEEDKVDKPTEVVTHSSTQISDLICKDKTGDSINWACSIAPNSIEEIEIMSPPCQQHTETSCEESTVDKIMEATLVPQVSGLFRIIKEDERISTEVVDIPVDSSAKVIAVPDAQEDDSISDVTKAVPISSYLHRNVTENNISQNVNAIIINSCVSRDDVGNSNVSEPQEIETVNVCEIQQDAEVILHNDKVTNELNVLKELADAVATVQLGEMAATGNNGSVVHVDTESSIKLLQESINPGEILVDNAATTKEVNSTDPGAVLVADSVTFCGSARPISSSDVSDVSDLVIGESQLQDQPKLKPRTKVHRRQSWSSSQETSRSSEHHSERKVKHRSGVPWCDEGDLSNGALADSDTGSSDNMARRSIEEVEKRINGNAYPVRNKIATWFDSFGKGAKKKERKIRSTSQNYPEINQSRDIRVLRPAPCIPGSTEKFENALTPARIERTPSGVSDILDNIPVAEQDRDSDSDPEEHMSPMTEEQRKERKVFFIAQELMTSERQFVDVLKLLNIDFVNAVNAAGTEQYPVIPSSELSKILQSLPQLQRLNEELLRDLELRIQNWSSYPKIADVIVKKGPFLKLYSSYIKNFGNQCKYLDDFCSKYPKFSKVVKEFEASPVCKKLGVKHYMLKPVQRIPQYRLLLEDYQRKLDVNSPDYQDTEEALKIVRDVADHANQTIKLGDHLSKMMELQSQLLDYEIIKPGRLYLKDGELFKLSRKVRHPRYFILLNDCLLYTSRLNTSLLRVNKELPLAGMKVVPQGEDNLNEFNIISVARSFTLSASCAEERREWIEALEKAIKDHTNRKLTFQAMSLGPSPLSEPLKLGHQAPVWIQDARVTMCQSCTAQFTLTHRRHHCRACGKVVCGVCSEYRAPLRYRSFQAERVCEDCYDAILNEFNDPWFKEAVKNVLLEAGFKNPDDDFETIKNSFKKLGAGSKKKIMQLKDIPQRLKEVAANDTGSQVSGWLQRKARRSWKSLWFVLKEQVLYVYKAQEDVVAHESIPILGYKVEAMAERHFEMYEGIDAKLVFQLSHPGQQPLVFYAKDQHMANRWIKAMEEATVLH